MLTVPRRQKEIEVAGEMLGVYGRTTLGVRADDKADQLVLLLVTYVVRMCSVVG